VREIWGCSLNCDNWGRGVLFTSTLVFLLNQILSAAVGIWLHQRGWMAVKFARPHLLDYVWYHHHWLSCYHGIIMFLDADDMQLPHTKSIAELKDALQRTSPQKSEPRRTSVSNSRPMSANEGGGHFEQCDHWHNSYWQTLLLYDLMQYNESVSKKKFCECCSKHRNKLLKFWS